MYNTGHASSIFSVYCYLLAEDYHHCETMKLGRMGHHWPLKELELRQSNHRLFHLTLKTNLNRFRSRFRCLMQQLLHRYSENPFLEAILKTNTC